MSAISTSSVPFMEATDETFTPLDGQDLFDDGKGELANEYGASVFARVDQDTPFSCRPPKHRLNLAWRNLNYKIVSAQPASENPLVQLAVGLLPLPAALLTRLGLYKTVELPILNNVSGQVRAGELVAIMGPTGSGKTTLLNVLSKRITHGGKHHLTGRVLINGDDRIDASRLKRRMAYVLQDDIFFPDITVRQTVKTAAQLKLSRKLSTEDKAEAVEAVLSELGITRCANTIVGDGWTRGVSGGERKRTNIATEIVGNRPLVFLDEPTTGLDAATSLGLVVSMRSLAQSGHTVVATIHQPSSAMFLMFDRVILLAEGGWTVYSGPTKSILPYFASLGLHAPRGYNGADFSLEVVSCHKPTKDGRTVRQLLIDSYAADHPTEEDKDGDDDDDVVENEESSAEELKNALNDLRKGKKYATPVWTQVWVLAQRTFKQRSTEILCWRQVILAVAVAVLCGLLWLRLDKTEDRLDDKNGFLFFSTMYWMMLPWFDTLMSFPNERRVLNKERDTGTFRLSAYLIGKMLAELPLTVIMPCVFATITYWMVGLTTNAGAYFIYLLAMALINIFSLVMGLLVAVTIVDMAKAMVTSVVIQLVVVLLGGFFISKNTLPEWVRWARWLSFLKYQYELVLLNEYQVGDDTYTPAANNSQYLASSNSNMTGGAVITGDDILDHINVETKLWADFLFLAGSIGVALVLTYTSLRFLHTKRF